VDRDLTRSPISKHPEQDIPTQRDASNIPVFDIQRLAQVFQGRADRIKACAVWGHRSFEIRFSCAGQIAAKYTVTFANQTLGDVGHVRASVGRAQAVQEHHGRQIL
jgi:hypothetical protein